MQESKTRHTTDDVSFMHKSEVTRTQRLGKSVQMMKFSHVMQNDISTLAGKGVHNVESSMDSAFGVHPDFKSHVGAMMIFKCTSA